MLVGLLLLKLLEAFNHLADKVQGGVTVLNLQLAVTLTLEPDLSRLTEGAAAVEERIQRRRKRVWRAVNGVATIPSGTLNVLLLRDPVRGCPDKVLNTML